MLYFKLEYQYSIAQKATFWEKIIDRLLSHFVPMANPTLEENLGYVKEWYIEYDDVEEYANREVGVAENGLVVFKAPFEENWGYWCDLKIRGMLYQVTTCPYCFILHLLFPNPKRLCLLHLVLCLSLLPLVCRP